MKHEDDQWEKFIRKGPFAASPFTEDHKRNVIQQVEWIQTRKCEEKNSGTLKPVSGSKSLVHFKNIQIRLQLQLKTEGNNGINVCLSQRAVEVSLLQVWAYW